MQFTLIAASLLAAAGISVAAPLQVRDDPICPLVKEGDDVWKISTLWARKLDGKTLSALTFNIQATNGGTLNFTCGASADKLESSKIYSCGENSSIFFSWNDASNALLLQQSVSDEYVLHFQSFTRYDTNIFAVSNRLEPLLFLPLPALEAVDLMILSSRAFLRHTSLSPSTPVLPGLLRQI